jgi:predicted nucleic acid-binding protein
MDAGPLLALYGNKDENRQAVRALFDLYFLDDPYALMIAPFPILYETLASQLTKFSRSIEAMRRDWERLDLSMRIEKVSDVPYREDQLQSCFAEIDRGSRYRSLSLVDRVLRAMMQDRELGISHLFTFNPGDFADVCEACGIEMITRHYL